MEQLLSQEELVQGGNIGDSVGYLSGKVLEFLSLSGQEVNMSPSSAILATSALKQLAKCWAQTLKIGPCFLSTARMVPAFSHPMAQIAPLLFLAGRSQSHAGELSA